MPRSTPGQVVDARGSGGPGVGSLPLGLLLGGGGGVVVPPAPALGRVQRWEQQSERLNAASAVGDDRIQKSQGGSVKPDTFTHGTSEQRDRWFSRGYANGSMQDCDTFSASSL